MKDILTFINETNNMKKFVTKSLNSEIFEKWADRWCSNGEEWITIDLNNCDFIKNNEKIIIVANRNDYCPEPLAIYNYTKKTISAEPNDIETIFDDIKNL